MISARPDRNTNTGYVFPVFHIKDLENYYNVT